LKQYLFDNFESIARVKSEKIISEPELIGLFKDGRSKLSLKFPLSFDKFGSKSRH